MCAKLLIDGEPSDAAWPYERSCQYGDGLFETIAVFSGRPCLWTAHLARLAEGSARLGITLPDDELLAREAGHGAQADFIAAVEWVVAQQVPPEQRALVAALAGLALGVEPFQMSQLFQQPGGKAEPVCIHRLGGMCGIQGTREFRQAEVTLMMGGQYLVDGIRVVEVHALGQAQANVLFKAPGQVIDLRDLAFHPALHQRGDGGGEQPQYGLLAAAQAGAVAAGQGQVVLFVQQDRFQRADALRTLVVPVLNESVQVFEKPPERGTQRKKHHQITGPMHEQASPGPAHAKCVNEKNEGQPQRREAMGLNCLKP